jgi:hypothetical protein
MASPTTLSLAALRRSGFVADVCERFIAQAGVRRDLFGCIDIIAIDRRQPGILAVQCTTLDHVAGRLAKARSKPELTAWLKAGGRFAVWGWFKRNGRWQVKQVEVRGEDLEAVDLTPRRWRGKCSAERGLFDALASKEPLDAS